MIQEAQVWHTYCAFFEVGTVTLKEVGSRLVNGGVALFAVHCDGTMWYLGKEGASEARLEFDRAPFDHVMKVTAPKDLDEFHLDCATQAAAWVHARATVLEPDVDAPSTPEDEYLIVNYAPCLLQADIGMIQVRPRLILRANGVYSFQVSICTGDTPISPEDVGRFVNIRRLKFSEMWIPPAAYGTGLRKGIAERSTNRRVRKFSKRKEALVLAASEMCRPVPLDGVEVLLAPFLESELGFALRFEHLRESLLYTTYEFAFTMKDRRNIERRVGTDIDSALTHFISRPTIILLRWDDQPRIMPELTKAGMALIDQFIFRGSKPRKTADEKRSGRLFADTDDYNVFFRMPLTIIAFGQNAVNAVTQKDWL